MALPEEARKETLDKALLEMVGQKKRLEAERAFLSDQLTQVRPGRATHPRTQPGCGRRFVCCGGICCGGAVAVGGRSRGR